MIITQREQADRLALQIQEEFPYLERVEVVEYKPTFDCLRYALHLVFNGKMQRFEDISELRDILHTQFRRFWPEKTEPGTVEVPGSEVARWIASGLDVTVYWTAAFQRRSIPAAQFNRCSTFYRDGSSIGDRARGKTISMPSSGMVEVADSCPWPRRVFEVELREHPQDQALRDAFSSQRFGPPGETFTGNRASN